MHICTCKLHVFSKYSSANNKPLIAFHDEDYTSPSATPWFSFGWTAHSGKLHSYILEWTIEDNGFTYYFTHLIVTTRRVFIVPWLCSHSCPTSHYANHWGCHQLACYNVTCSRTWRKNTPCHCTRCFDLSHRRQPTYTVETPLLLLPTCIHHQVSIFLQEAGCMK